MTQPDRAARGGRAHRPWAEDVGARRPRLDAGAAASPGYAISSKNRGCRGEFQPCRGTRTPEALACRPLDARRCSL